MIVTALKASETNRYKQNLKELSSIQKNNSRSYERINKQISFAGLNVVKLGKDLISDNSIQANRNLAGGIEGLSKSIGNLLKRSKTKNAIQLNENPIRFFMPSYNDMLVEEGLHPSPALAPSIFTKTMKNLKNGNEKLNIEVTNNLMFDDSGYLSAEGGDILTEQILNIMKAKKFNPTTENLNSILNDLNAVKAVTIKPYDSTSTSIYNVKKMIEKAEGGESIEKIKEAIKVTFKGLGLDKIEIPDKLTKAVNDLYDSLGVESTSEIIDMVSPIRGMFQILKGQINGDKKVTLKGTVCVLDNTIGIPIKHFVTEIVSNVVAKIGADIGGAVGTIAGGTPGTAAGAGAGATVGKIAGEVGFRVIWAKCRDELVDFISKLLEEDKGTYPPGDGLTLTHLSKVCFDFLNEKLPYYQKFSEKDRAQLFKSLELGQFPIQTAKQKQIKLEKQQRLDSLVNTTHVKIIEARRQAELEAQKKQEEAKLQAELQAQKTREITLSLLVPGYSLVKALFKGVEALSDLLEGNKQDSISSLFKRKSKDNYYNNDKHLHL